MNQHSGTQTFEDIVWQSQAAVRALIAGMGALPADVDDLAQETYLQLYRHFDKIPPGVPPDVWVKGIAKKVCLNHLRKRARRDRLHRHALAEILAGTTTPLERTSAGEALQAALADCLFKLPSERRKMLEQRYEKELTSEEMAEENQSSPEAVRVALHRIRAGLRDCIVQKLARQS